MVQRMVVTIIIIIIIIKIAAERMESNRLLIPPAELLNRGGWPPRGEDCFGSAEYCFSVMRSLEIIFAAKCPDVVL